ncbi:MAG: hypothetical protein AAGF19_01500 [Pseudomonadota bacterium]
MALGLLLGVEPAKAAGEGSSTGGAQSVAPFVLVEPIVLPVIKNKRPYGFLIVEFIVDTEDPGTATIVKKSMPRLRDAYIQTLSEYVWFEYRHYEPVKLGRLDARLQSVTDWTIGDRKTRILFRQVMVQGPS